ncbi:MAG: NAD(P)-dependent oxidoreductase [bacterium]
MSFTSQHSPVGFIGPGIMGLPMARRLRNAGYDVRLFARRQEQRESLQQEGWKVSCSAAELGREVSTVFICVGDTPDVEAVIFGPEGLVQSLAEGSAVVDMSTVSPLKTREFAQALATRSIQMLDAPVSGGEQGAIAGTLSIMVGGKTDTLEQVMPLLRCMGTSIVHVGDHGAGQVAKACNQVLVAQTITGVAEALSLAEAAGVDAGKVREALLGGFANSKILEVHGQRMLEDNYQPGFKIKLHRKDMNIALDTAAQLELPLSGAELVRDHLDALADQGMGELDSSAIKQLKKPKR